MRPDVGASVAHFSARATARRALVFMANRVVSEQRTTPRWIDGDWTAAQRISKRSSIITLLHAFAKSRTNFSSPSDEA